MGTRSEFSCPTCALNGVHITRLFSDNPLFRGSALLVKTWLRDIISPMDLWWWWNTLNLLSLNSSLRFSPAHHPQPQLLCLTCKLDIEVHIWEHSVCQSHTRHSTLRCWQARLGLLILFVAISSHCNSLLVLIVFFVRPGNLHLQSDRAQGFQNQSGQA